MSERCRTPRARRRHRWRSCVARGRLADHHRDLALGLALVALVALVPSHDLRPQLFPLGRRRGASPQLPRVLVDRDLDIGVGDEVLVPARVLAVAAPRRTEEHTSELQSLMRTSYAVFCLKTTKIPKTQK